MEAGLPKDDPKLWDWLTAIDETRRAALLTHCVSFGVNALHEKGDRYGGLGVSVHGIQDRLSEAGRLTRAAGLDIVAVGGRSGLDNSRSLVATPRCSGQNLCATTSARV